MGAGDGATAVTAEGWVGVGALLVALLALVIQRLDARASSKVQEAQAAAIDRLRDIEEARHERELEEARLRELADAEAEEAARQFSLSADLRVDTTALSPGEPDVRLFNLGQHRAVLLAVGLVREGQATTSLYDTDDDDAVWIEPGTSHRLSLESYHPGPAKVHVAWSDGMGEWTAEHDVMVPAPWGPLQRPSWLQGRVR